MTHTVGPELLLTVEGAAQSLNLSRAKLFQLIRDGEIDTVKIGAARRVPVDALREYVARLRGQ